MFPSLYVEAKHAYSWCLNIKKFTIYTGYHDSIIEKLYKQNSNENKQKKTILIIDDATAFCNELRLSTNEIIVKLVSQARHYKCTIWLLVHTLKNVISTTLRDNLSFIIIYDITNKRLLDTIWEEYLSIFVDEKEFLVWYRQLEQIPYSSFLLKTKKTIGIDINSNEWTTVKKYRLLHENNIIH